MAFMDFTKQEAPSTQCPKCGETIPLDKGFYDYYGDYVCLECFRKQM